MVHDDRVHPHVADASLHKLFVRSFELQCVDWCALAGPPAVDTLCHVGDVIH